MKILLPTDGSRYAVAAARTLAAWFVRPGMHVDLLHVLPDPAPPPRRPQAAIESAIRHGKAAARAALDETAAPLVSQGVRVNSHVVDGDPRKEVLEWARRGYDLVAVGARGRGDIPFFDVGSVALAVLERAPAPVLMARGRSPSEPVATPSDMRPLQVVLAVDGGGPARHAASALPHLITAAPTRVQALAVGDELEGGALPEHAARSIADRTAKELGDHGFTAMSRVEIGPVAPAILELAADADLVALGSRALQEGRDREHGSVALEVARSAPCSVLILRDGPSAPGALEIEGSEETHTIPFELALRDVEPAPTIDRQVLRGVESIEALVPYATRCDVLVERSHPRHRTGNLYHVRVDLSVPGSKVAVSRTPPEHRESETLVTALAEAFRKLRYRLIEAQERKRGAVKRHEVPAHGTVTELFPDHGFIAASDGRIVYFHRNSVLGDAWGDLETGAEVRFTVERGAEGPQATSVSMVGKHHPVG